MMRWRFLLVSILVGVTVGLLGAKAMPKRLVAAASPPPTPPPPVVPAAAAPAVERAAIAPNRRPVEPPADPEVVAALRARFDGNDRPWQLVRMPPSTSALPDAPSLAFTGRNLPARDGDGVTISVGVRATAAMHARLEGRLYAGERLVGSSESEADLPVGEGTITLRFSARLLAAAAIAGPYTLGDLALFAPRLEATTPDAGVLIR